MEARSRQGQNAEAGKPGFFQFFDFFGARCAGCFLLRALAASELAGSSSQPHAAPPYLAVEKGVMERPRSVPASTSGHCAKSQIANTDARVRKGIAV
jgi:hypothetical protein